MKQKKIKVGVIGLGRIYPRHIDDSINKIPELELAAVCDIKKELADNVAKKEKVKAYYNYLDLIKDPNIELVTICTPNGSHTPIAIEVAKHGKDCVVEKPIGLDYPQASLLVKAFKKAKKNLFPVLQVRYNPAVAILHKFIQNGSLGKIYSGALTVRWTRPMEYFKESDWKGTLRLDGGSLLTQAIHYIDVMQLVLGKAKSVCGKMSRVAHNIECEDMANAIIDFKNGARINLEFTINTYPHNLECSLTILGEYGTIKIGGLAMNECELWHVKNTPQPEISRGFSPNIYANGLYTGSCPNHIFIYKNVVNVLCYGKKTEIEASGALESLHIIDAIKKSSETHCEINL